LKNTSRLDAVLVERGLAASRERARALVLAGRVIVNGQRISKAGTQIKADDAVALLEPDHPYVSRGGIKLAHALDEFAISVDGRIALDIGASTGGFTDVLLQRNAARVVALDVGHGQLDWTLRQDPRVVVIEHVNARGLTPDRFPDTLRVFDIITIDVSFISLRHILPVVPGLLATSGDVVALVKPQFEAGRAEVGKGGIVRSDEVRRRVVGDVAVAADALGLDRVAEVESPIAGAEGNREILLHLRRRPSFPAGDAGA
jgi:23S rRNA (cytidine1920-2'-O)/16S rRNA (cytidine1409-2'-O)-methyltransferase